MTHADSSCAKLAMAEGVSVLKNIIMKQVIPLRLSP